MKKTYMCPSAKVTHVQFNRNLLFSISDKSIEEESGGWAKEDNGWNIWGSDDVE